MTLYPFILVLVHIVHLTISAGNFDVGRCNMLLNTALHGNQQANDDIPASSRPQQQQVRVGKAGPRGVKGEKGDAAVPCDCLTNEDLFDRIKALEG